MTLVATPRTLPTKHKAYAAVLAAALVALAYDKGCGSGPPPARAAVPVAEVAAPAAVAGPPSDVPATLSDLAGRLRALGVDPAGDVRDAFAPPAAWAAERRADPAAAAGPADADAFRADHRLTVVLVGGGPGAAVIGGRLVRVGQAVDGYRLVTVTPRSAHLTGPAGTAVDLRLP